MTSVSNLLTSWTVMSYLTNIWSLLEYWLNQVKFIFIIWLLVSWSVKIVISYLTNYWTYKCKIKDSNFLEIPQLMPLAMLFFEVYKNLHFSRCWKNLWMITTSAFWFLTYYRKVYWSSKRIRRRWFCHWNYDCCPDSAYCWRGNQ